MEVAEKVAGHLDFVDDLWPLLSRMLPKIGIQAINEPFVLMAQLFAGVAEIDLDDDGLGLTMGAVLGGRATAGLGRIFNAADS